MRLTGYLLFISAILAFDAATKYAVDRSLPLMEASSPTYPYGGIAVFEDILGVRFSIAHTTNTGAAWGNFSGHSGTLLILRIVLISGLVLYAIKGAMTTFLRVALCMVIAGAVGNVLDVLIYGHVVDMLFFELWGYPYPVFNVADIFICVGIGLLILASFIPSVSSKESE